MDMDVFTALALYHWMRKFAKSHIHGRVPHHALFVFPIEQCLQGLLWHDKNFLLIPTSWLKVVNDS